MSVPFSRDQAIAIVQPHMEEECKGQSPEVRLRWLKRQTIEYSERLEGFVANPGVSLNSLLRGDLMRCIFGGLILLEDFQRSEHKVEIKLVEKLRLALDETLTACDNEPRSKVESILQELKTEVDGL